MPEIVKAHIRKSCFRQQLFHAGVTAVRHDGVFRVDRVREYPLGDGCPFSRGQQLHRAGRQLDDPASRTSFRFAHIVTAALLVVECSADGQRSFFRIKVCPHESAYFAPPQAGGDLQIEEVVPALICLNSFHESFQLFVIEDSFCGSHFLRQCHIVGGVLYDQVAVNSRIQRLMQDAVYPADRGGRQRPAVHAALPLQLSIQGLNIGSSHLADLFAAKGGFDISLCIPTVALVCGWPDRRFGTLLQPDVQPLPQCHAAVLRKFGTVILDNAPMHLFHQSLLRLRGYIVEDRVAVFLVSDHNTPFPATIVTLAYHAVTGWPSFRHLQLSLPSVFLCIGIAFPALPAACFTNTPYR